VRRFEFRPAWLSLQPEITCRQLDGSGYGGCWHSRVTGLLGEALNVGGVFTQHFPILSTSITGIAKDTHGIIGNVREKYFTPEPPAKTFGEKVRRVLKRVWTYASALVLALAKGGSF